MYNYPEAVSKRRAKHVKEFFGQFGEDTIITNLLRKIDNGMYLDIGAYDPFRYSNTALLYESGWTGVNIDPNVDVIKRFKQTRPDDINLNVAISNSPGEMDYYKFSKPAANTIEKSQVEEWTKRFGEPEIHKVRTDTVSNLLKKNKVDPSKIHYMNIDAEGHDFIILQSIDFETILPMVVSVEIHAGNDLMSVLDTEATKLLMSKGYKLSSYLHATAIFVHNQL